MEQAHPEKGEGDARRKRTCALGRWYPAKPEQHTTKHEGQQGFGQREIDHRTDGGADDRTRNKWKRDIPVYVFIKLHDARDLPGEDEYAVERNHNRHGQQQRRARQREQTTTETCKSREETTDKTNGRNQDQDS